jgi:hypothetical protein
MSLVAMKLRFRTLPPANYGSVAQVTSTDPQITG